MTTCERDCDVDGDGCKIDGKPLFWAGACVGLSLQRDGGGKLPREDVVFAVDQALESWVTSCGGDEAASMSLTAYKSTSCGRAVYNKEGPNANAIVFRDGGVWDHDNELGNTLGYTTVSFNVGTGEIYGADIELNNTDGQLGVPTAKGDYDLQSVITHELGHVLGIGHTQDETALMFPSLPTQEARHDLGDDDRAAICEVYSPDRRTTKCTAVPRGGFTADCSLRVLEPEAEPVSSCALVRRGGVGDDGARPAVILAGLALALGALRSRRFGRSPR